MAMMDQTRPGDGPVMTGDDGMPALDAVRQLQHDMEAGAASPLSLLGQAVLHDERVIDRVLRVANHQAGQQGVGTITTLGRAIALLGFAQVRNFCITARLMETLLRDRSHSATSTPSWSSQRRVKPPPGKTRIPAPVASSGRGR